MKIEYPAILAPAEEGGYLVDFPDFEGEAFTEGDTLDEALSNATEVLCLVLGYRLEKGEAVPAPSHIAGPNVYRITPT
ncbi:type II toxin-antitoxin system HicB family antitoxin [Geobacter sulfurreducens]|uniref:type II toxin-antitoxin system HicB family antitoxin n=1 Tax=Geobacter sulfurreducens TaxID=35554 RepID=UPI0020B69564|nr:type II toxin-antitoxin system HicB family antitoxin [Geobacter sulfurreducens]UTG93170.1 type II toxin-antitoxin system HicB family antitoxin [Geobacter sulfurreducens]